MDKESFISYAEKYFLDIKARDLLLYLEFESLNYKNHRGAFVFYDEHVAILNYGGAEYLNHEQFLDYVAKKCKLPNKNLEEQVIKFNLINLNDKIKVADKKSKIKV